MKHLLAALIAVAAFGAGCDRNNEPADDRLVPQSGEVQNRDTDTSGAVSPGMSPGNVTPQQGAPRESGGGLDTESAEDTQNLQEPKTERSLDRARGEAGGEEGPTGPDATTEQQDQTQQPTETEAETSEAQTSQANPQDQGTLSPQDRKEREGSAVAVEEQAEQGGEQVEQQAQQQVEQDGEYAQQQIEQGGQQTGAQSMASTSVERECPIKSYEQPMFLRQDIAYAVTGEDCYGDPATSYSVSIGVPNEARGRMPASQDQPTCANHESWSNPLFLRQDIAYGLTGEDCYGDEPYTRE